MAEADLHLKLDRILARQDEQMDATADLEQSVSALVSGLSVLSDGLNTQTELLERVIEAISAETPDSGLHDVLASIQASLKQIAEDGTRMVTVIIDPARVILPEPRFLTSRLPGFRCDQHPR